MKATAIVRYARMSPQKARLVVDMVRGKKVSDALTILRFTNKATARVIEKLIVSAKNNAEVKNVADPEKMKIETIFVDKGPIMKRQLPRARGRVDILHKPLSHVTVILEEIEEPQKKKPSPKPARAKAEVPAEKKSAKPKAKAPAKKAVKKTSPAAAAKARPKKDSKKKQAAKPAKKTSGGKTTSKKTSAKKTSKGKGS